MSTFAGVMKHPPNQAFGPTINRLGDLMAHSTRFAFFGVTRLAAAAGVDPASVSRVLSGQQNPTYLMVIRLTEALEEELGLSIDPRDIFAEEGQFLTRFTCDLCGCPGCLPRAAYDEFQRLVPEYQTIKPGAWVTSRYPRGFTSLES